MTNRSSNMHYFHYRNKYIAAIILTYSFTHYTDTVKNIDGLT